MLENFVPPYSAHVVELLEEEGGGDLHRQVQPRRVRHGVSEHHEVSVVRSSIR